MSRWCGSASYGGPYGTTGGGSGSLSPNRLFAGTVLALHTMGDNVKLEALIRSLQARVVHPSASTDVEIDHVFAGDKISDLLEHAEAHTLIVTSLANTQLLRIAELMEAPVICLVGGIEPEAELSEAAASTGTALIVSPFELFETCGRLYRATHPGSGNGV
jgi:hypothetical protein